MPGMVEAEAMKPVHSVGAFKADAKSFRTGLLDIVELKIANKPMMQSIQKTVFFDGEFIVESRLR
jgi:hypothetical protein